MTKILVLLIAVLALAGCQTREAYNADKCREYGAKPGTDAYTQCRATMAASADRRPLVIRGVTHD